MGRGESKVGKSRGRGKSAGPKKAEPKKEAPVDSKYEGSLLKGGKPTKRSHEIFDAK